MRQQRTLKINPPNLSPARGQRQPLRNIINMPKQAWNAERDHLRFEKPQPRKQLISSFLTTLAPHSNTNSHSKPNQFGSSDSEILPVGQFMPGNSRSARNSLKPPKRNIDRSWDGDCCSNHAEKQAKFKAHSEESDLFYCEKCAILLASQGFKVEKLPTTNSSLLVGAQPTLSSPPIYEDNRFVQESEAFMQDINQFLGKSKLARQYSEEERGKVQHYYRSLLEQIDEYEQQLKTSIGIMMGQQRQDILKMAGDSERSFTDKQKKLETAERQLQVIVQDIQINLETISSLDESEFNPIMRKYEQTLQAHMDQLYKLKKVEYSRVELIQPKPEAVQQLIGIISQCGLQLKVLDNEPSNKKQGLRTGTEQSEDKRFFTFEKNLQRDPLPSHEEHSREESRLRLSELKTSFEGGNYHSYHSGEQEVMQESIVHDDFSNEPR